MMTTNLDNFNKLLKKLHQTDISLIYLLNMNFWITTKEPSNQNFYEDCAQGILDLNKARQKKIFEILKKGSF